MQVKSFLRVESAVIFVFSTLIYFFAAKGPWWLFVVLILAPDIFMLGYLINKKLGAFLYNIFHIYFWPLLLIIIGLFTDNLWFIWIGFIWMAHIGLDRAVGYGLKYRDSFKTSHLQKL